MKIIVIGGTGHIGSFLIPRLVLAGHEVVSISRQERKPYVLHEAWRLVTEIFIDRESSESRDRFGLEIAGLKPDVVIDLICFNLKSAKSLVQALEGKISHFLHCGTIWVHGHSEKVPTREDQDRRPFGAYGIKKAAIESYLISESRNGFPATVLHPGHIVGPGWAPLNPAGNFDTNVFNKLAKGQELVLPNFGMETVHHVHADDVAQAFCCAIISREQAIGESFHVVSEQALTLRGYATAMAAWFGKDINLKFLPWDDWKNTVSEADANATWDHISHSPNCSIEKAKNKLNYRPRYSSLEAVQESVNFLFDKLSSQ
jgi:nucleoside-diphosphate-sugar epimerase